MYPTSQGITAPTENNYFTVSRLNHQIRMMLEANASHILLIGEISNFARPSSGHWYFTLKDDNAQIRAAMFRSQNARINFTPNNGMQVIVRANVTLYEPRGDYQLVVENMKPAGEGLLQQKFEALKNKLQAEGLFDAIHKKTLPISPKSVGVITSASGAALQDILNVLKRRDPSLPVIIYPTMVQGQQAIEEIAQMIEIANQRQEVDVLIVARGGGSLEDLWCFNEERVARAIFASVIPIISGVGHETDVTIADFVADVRAPTPSAAAELVSRDSQEQLLLVKRLFQRLQMSCDYCFSQKQQEFDKLYHRLKYQHPQLKITRQMMRLNETKNRLEYLVNHSISKQKQLLVTLNNKILAFNPHHVQLNKLAGLQHRLMRCNPSVKINKLHQLLEQKKNNLSHLLNQKLTRNAQRVNRADKALYPSVLNQITSHKKMQQVLSQRILKIDIRYLISLQQNTLGLLMAKSSSSMEVILAKSKSNLSEHCLTLDALSPLKTLNRGYSIAFSENKKRVSSRTQVKKGDKLQMRVKDGVIVSEVISTSNI